MGYLPKTQWHAHCGETWLFGLDDKFSVRVANSGQVHTATSAVIPAATRHILHAPDTRVGVVLLDPVLSAPATRSGDLVTPHLDADHWIRSLSQDLSIDSDPGQWAHSRSLSHSCVDHRVLAAADMVDSRLTENQPISALAKQVALSESRLQHLFASQTGLRLRQYRLWMRLLRTARDTVQGQTLTDAAYANGFSSSSHFSSSFRKSFGLAPRQILSSNSGSTSGSLLQAKRRRENQS